MIPEYIYTWKHNKSVGEDTMRQIKELSPNKVIDFGAGDGFYCKLLKYINPAIEVVGVEAESSYSEKFGLLELYDRLVIGNLENFINGIKKKDFDLAIFGDVLEHLEKGVVVEVIKKAAMLFPYIIINSPVGYQEQNSEIPSEIHRCGLYRETFNTYNVLEWHSYDDDTMFNCLLKGEDLLIKKTLYKG